jgi:hypothetical protein
MLRTQLANLFNEVANQFGFRTLANMRRAERSTRQQVGGSLLKRQCGPFLTKRI